MSLIKTLFWCLEQAQDFDPQRPNNHYSKTAIKS